jgi:hypothetical protein
MYVVKLLFKRLSLSLEDYDVCEFTIVLIAMVNLGRGGENLHKLSAEKITPAVVLREHRRTIRGAIRLNIMICFVKDIVCK